MYPDREEHRPSPEALLRVAQAEEQEQRRGRLTIFLGYAAGVGKTYAMLKAAQQLRDEGREVVAAYVESHGRAETDALLAGLEVLPPARYPHQGVELAELDLDAVLAREPELALVDELAHTNAPGCRHEKRWQDVEELLTAGIDIATTVNVQHFESASDIAAQITGIPVRETVPDSLLDQAAEVMLVDIPPETLLQRLRQGKVYVREQASQAVRQFFRPGNLIALREMALRRTAVRVDDDMRTYMATRAIAGPWPVAERLLVCASGSPYSERLIRATRRLADELKAQWFTVYVETPRLAREQQENRQRVWRDLRLAESLGAEVATVTAPSVPRAIVEYAVRHNVTRIVVGKPAKPRWRELLRPPIVDQIIRLSGSIHVQVLSFEQEVPPAGIPALSPTRIGPWAHYLVSLALVAVATALPLLLWPRISPTNQVMIYLLAVVLVAMRFGRNPAVFTAVFGVLALDFFFIAPRWSFTVTDTEYLVTFLGLFTVGVVISTLMAETKMRAEALREREIQTESLYYLSRDLAVAIDMASILEAVRKNVGESLQAHLAVLIADPEDEQMRVAALGENLALDAKEMAVADWAYRNRRPAGNGTETLGSAHLLYLPLCTASRCFGVLGVALAAAADYRSPHHRRLLDAFGAQISLAMERVHLARQAEQAQVLEARETLERALLNSISHDLRTPLVTIIGALSSVCGDAPPLPEPKKRELLRCAWDEAERLNRFVGNLLDMTRLEAGEMRINREPCDIQDLIGSALTILDQKLAGRDVSVQLAEGLPLVGIDMVLVTQVLVNLLDNGLKYSPVESPLEIAARIDGGHLVLEVLDRGPGVAEQDLQRMFEKFYRLPVPEGVGGTGLGLSICKGIVEAHHGTICAANRAGGGLRVVCRLPVQP
ncbi:sensor histidine kinase [Desulfobulbus elongatus]|uniref:sensor histidine kinase n=1 Tax=Desulfobulbus elongatus TaxID=53332 RepID=UPI0004848F67|nr:sensor histidine kinase KdpD [Desulfobulbus elongatus]